MTIDRYQSDQIDQTAHVMAICAVIAIVFISVADQTRQYLAIADECADINIPSTKTLPVLE